MLTDIFNQSKQIAFFNISKYRLGSLCIGQYRLNIAMHFFIHKDANQYKPIFVQYCKYWLRFFMIEKVPLLILTNINQY